MLRGFWTSFGLNIPGGICRKPPGIKVVITNVGLIRPLWIGVAFIIYGFYLMIFPLPYSFGSGIFDHWPFHSGVLASIFMLGMIIAYFGDRYESKKNKKDE